MDRSANGFGLPALNRVYQAETDGSVMRILVLLVSFCANEGIQPPHPPPPKRFPDEVEYVYGIAGTTLLIFFASVRSVHAGASSYRLRTKVRQCCLLLYAH